MTNKKPTFHVEHRWSRESVVPSKHLVEIGQFNDLKAYRKQGRTSTNAPVNYVQKVESPLMTNFRASRSELRFLPDVLAAAENTIITRDAGESLLQISQRSGFNVCPWRDVGHALAQLHSQVLDFIPEDLLKTIPLKTSGLFHLDALASFARTVKSRNLQEFLARNEFIETRCREAKSVWDVNWTVAHGDFALENIAVTPSTRQVTILDWEHFCRADPAWDLGNIVAEVSSMNRHGPKNPSKECGDVIREILDGYLGQRKFSTEGNVNFMARTALYVGFHFIRLAQRFRNHEDAETLVLNLAEDWLQDLSRSHEFIYGGSV